jgi:predicted RNA-binding Zn-ribbon protein involved in translation (DUF1610 family)
VYLAAIVLIVINFCFVLFFTWIRPISILVFISIYFTVLIIGFLICFYLLKKAKVLFENMNKLEKATIIKEKTKVKTSTFCNYCNVVVSPSRFVGVRKGRQTFILLIITGLTCLPGIGLILAIVWYFAHTPKCPNCGNSELKKIPIDSPTQIKQTPILGRDIRMCPTCHTIVAITDQYCPQCGKRI